MSFFVLHNSICVRKDTKVNQEPQVIVTLSTAFIDIYLLKGYSFTQEVFIKYLQCVSSQASLFTRYHTVPHGANILIREIGVKLITIRIDKHNLLSAMKEKY